MNPGAHSRSALRRPISARALSVRSGKDTMWIHDGRGVEKRDSSRSCGNSNRGGVRYSNLALARRYTHTHPRFSPSYRFTARVVPLPSSRIRNAHMSFPKLSSVSRIFRGSVSGVKSTIMASRSGGRNTRAPMIAIVRSLCEARTVSPCAAELVLADSTAHSPDRACSLGPLRHPGTE